MKVIMFVVIYEQTTMFSYIWRGMICRQRHLCNTTVVHL